MALKAALVPAIIGIVVFIVGVVLLILGVTSGGTGLLIGGIIVLVVGIGFFVIAYFQAVKRLNAICPECQKFMGNSDKAVNYSYVCNQYKENYDNNNKFRDYTFYYTCSVVCPHCGSTATFEYHINAKTEPKANCLVDKYIKDILKLNK